MREHRHCGEQTAKLGRSNVEIKLPSSGDYGLGVMQYFHRRHGDVVKVFSKFCVSIYSLLNKWTLKTMEVFKFSLKNIVVLVEL